MTIQISRKTAAIILLLVGVAIVWAQSPRQNSSDTGRYQLFNGIYPHKNFDSKHRFERQELFKIDTHTGKVWQFTSYEIGDVSPSYFVEIGVDK